MSRRRGGNSFAAPTRLAALVPVSIGLFLLALACDEGDPQFDTDDATGGDSGGDCASEGVEPSDPCLPECGNDLGVGEPCSPGGGECNDNESAILCTVDFQPDVALHFCSKACVADEDCGVGAICGVNPDDAEGPRGCVPASCT